MKIKKTLSALLAGAMLLNTVSVFGNIQDKLPADGINYMEVSHYSDANGNISPKADVTFKKASNTTQPSTGNITNDKAEAEYYKLRLEDSLGNILEGRRMTSTGQDTYTVGVEKNLNDASQFANGRLYRLQVIPGHTHIIKDKDGKDVVVEAPLSSLGDHPERYFVTDFNTIAREVGDDIEIVWEYIPGAKYKLVYIDKDVDDKKGVDGTDGSIQAGVGSKTINITEENMTLITEGGIKKVKYTLEDTIPGQKYSAYVMVDGISSSFLKDSWSNVAVNRETPKIAKVAKSVNLEITNIGKNRIELKWNLRSWTDSQLVMTKIWRKTEGETIYTQIGTINNEKLEPKDPGRFEHDEPSKRSYYYVEFIMSDGSTLLTKEVLYVPYELREQPLSPSVPNPYSDAVKSQEDFNKKDYLVKNDDIAVDKMKDNTFHTKRINPLQLQLVWDAPMMKNAEGKEVVEHDMQYDIWVVEDEEQLQDKELEPIIKDLIIGLGDTDKHIKTQAKGEIVGFKEMLDSYITSKGEKKSLIANQTYYIKIVAKRNYSGVFSESIPTVIAITIGKNGDIFAPPVLSKPPLRIQENGIKQKSITIEWLEKWHEITARNPEAYEDENERFFAKLWNSRIFTGGTPAIKFKGETGLKEHLLLTANSVKAVKETVGAEVYAAEYRDREVTLGKDVQYEVKAVLYDEIIAALQAENEGVAPESALTLERWIVKNESNSTDGWQTIAPGEADNGDSLDWKEYTVEGLEPNTRYIILVRAYRTLDSGQKLQQTYPSYVIGTTMTDYEEPEANPTVPVLNPDGVTDTSVSVWWVYNKDFDYEIVYSRFDDVEKAEAWEFAISDEYGKPNYASDGSKVSVTIDGLVPETTYNVWIRAKQKKGTGVSHWSNPVTQKTKPLETPDPPRGLGPAAYQSILEIGQDFKPVTNEYITVEWLKDVSDVEAEENAGNNPKQYSYVVEFADNPEFLDSLLVDVTNASEGNHEVLAKNIVKFTELEANRPYYVRVKTVLTFKDAEGNREIKRESEYSAMVRILTKTSNDEYDGGENENIVIYPKPIEESFKDDIWTMEIVDAAKVITEIQAKKQYYYTITMEHYNNRYDAAVRRLVMPKSVLDTLSNQGMELRIVTKIGVYDIPAKTLQTYSKVHSASDRVQFDLTTAKSYNLFSIVRSYPESFIKGEQLEVIFKGKMKTTTVKKFDGYIRVKLKLDSPSAYTYRDFYTYTYKYDVATWTRENHTIEKLTETHLAYQTPYTGLYALYEKVISSNHLTTQTMSKLSNTYGIQGLGDVYFSKDYVHGEQFVNLMLGIAQNKKAINLSLATTADMMKAANTAGLYISTNKGPITEEQAIAGIVKLYELKQGYKIKPSSIKFNNVSTNYREAVSKAYAIGLIESINPQGKVTYGQLCEWIWGVIG